MEWHGRFEYKRWDSTHNFTASMISCMTPQPASDNSLELSIKDAVSNNLAKINEDVKKMLQDMHYDKSADLNESVKQFFKQTKKISATYQIEKTILIDKLQKLNAKYDPSANILADEAFSREGKTNKVSNC